MPTLEQALSDYGKAITSDKPFPAILGAYIAGSFQIIVPTDPAKAYVRHLDNTPTTAYHHNRVDLFKDPTLAANQNISIALYYDEFDHLAIWGLAPPEAGANLQTDPNTGAGAVKAVIAGTGVTVDSTDPTRPIVSASGSSSGSDAIYRELVGQSISNTSAQSSLLNSGVGSLLITANNLLAGDILRAHVTFFGGSKASASGDITLAVLMNSTPIAVLGPAAMVDGVSGAFIALDADILFQTIGASATVRAKFTLYCELFSTPFQVFWWGSVVNTTINQTLDIAVTFSTADPANTADSTPGTTYIERL